ncbi:MAG: VOC family protein [Reyranellaceae bacterium]
MENKGKVDDLHHLGLMTRDFETTFATYESLGFVLTPLSIHQWSDRPGVPVRPSGSGNRCALFQRNYLEINAHFGTPDPANANHARRERWLAAYDGLHIICFNSEDMAGFDVQLRDAGIASSGVVRLERDVDTPEGKRTAAFERVVRPDSGGPEELLQAARHLTPQYIFQSRWQAHPNGSVAMTDAIFCVADPDAYARIYAAATGHAVVREGARRIVRLETSRVTIVGPEDLDAAIPGAEPLALPCIAGFGVGTRDLATTESFLRGRGVPVTRAGDKVIVPAAAARGAAILFEAAA